MGFKIHKPFGIESNRGPGDPMTKLDIPDLQIIITALDELNYNGIQKARQVVTTAAKIELMAKEIQADSLQQENAE